MKLLDQVRDVVRKKHYSIRTEQAYVQWIRRFILFHNKRHPKDMGEIEISQYIPYLATYRKVASSPQNRVGRFRTHGEGQEAGEITNS